MLVLLSMRSFEGDIMRDIETLFRQAGKIRAMAEKREGFERVALFKKAQRIEAKAEKINRTNSRRRAI